MFSIKKRLTIIYLIMFFVLSISGENSTESSGLCGKNMVYIETTRFFTGISDSESKYLNLLCNKTAGGCYEKWFEREVPGQVVDVSSFCIDKYEYPNRRNAKPVTDVSWERAAAICHEEGKRLCTEYEWERACTGAVGYIWSYGYKYDSDVCNIHALKIENSGTYPGCRTIEGVFDMNGNVSEWVMGSVKDKSAGYLPEKTRLLKGGSFKDWHVFTRCGFRDFRAEKYSGEISGFRCCSNIY